jgi:gamma-butyrobetaine dioxygenase/trimethyllysine dioxygenase
MNGRNASVQLHADWLRVSLSDASLDFHYRFLRHAAGEVHPVTRERIVCSSEIPDDIHATRATLATDALDVTWSDGTKSSHAIAWLEAHAYARQRDAHDVPSSLALVELDARDFPSRETVIERALETLATHGLAVVRGFTIDTSPDEDTEKLIASIEAHDLALCRTHFGRIEDLRTDNTTNANTDQLGYTDSGIELHTDQPFLEHPPRYQLLQSIRAADSGGENFLVDARAASKHLRANDEIDHQLLTTTPVRFHRTQRAFESVFEAPVLDDHGADFRVRFSYFTMAPHRIAFSRMSAFYRAYDRFTRFVRAPQNQFRFLLAPGDFVIYDNHRMLHGRQAFRGPRWVRGVYFDAVNNRR